MISGSAQYHWTTNILSKYRIRSVIEIPKADYEYKKSRLITARNKLSDANHDQASGN